MGLGDLFNILMRQSIEMLSSGLFSSPMDLDELSSCVCLFLRDHYFVQFININVCV